MNHYRAVVTFVDGSKMHITIRALYVKDAIDELHQLYSLRYTVMEWE